MATTVRQTNAVSLHQLPLTLWSVALKKANRKKLNTSLTWKRIRKQKFFNLSQTRYRLKLASVRSSRKKSKVSSKGGFQPPRWFWSVRGTRSRVNYYQIRQAGFKLTQPRNSSTNFKEANRRPLEKLCLRRNCGKVNRNLEKSVNLWNFIIRLTLAVSSSTSSERVTCLSCLTNA